MAGPDLGKQIGPLPLGAWVALVGGGLLIAGYASSRGGGGSSGEVVEMSDTSGGYGGVGVGGTPAYTATGNSTPVVPEAEIVDNEQWGRMVIDELIRKNNYDPSLVTSAITKYLNSQELSASELTMVAAAIRDYKAPPSPLIPRVITNVPQVVTPVAAPAPVPAPVWTPPPAAPAPVPQPSERIYVVVPGDNLSRIAQRYYGRQDWQKIYNANRGVIGGNPNLIRPGQRLVIPY